MGGDDSTRLSSRSDATQLSSRSDSTRLSARTDATRLGVRAHEEAPEPGSQAHTPPVRRPFPPAPPPAAPQTPGATIVTAAVYEPGTNGVVHTTYPVRDRVAKTAPPAPLEFVSTPVLTLAQEERLGKIQRDYAQGTRMWTAAVALLGVVVFAGSILGIVLLAQGF